MPTHLRAVGAPEEQPAGGVRAPLAERAPVVRARPRVGQLVDVLDAEALGVVGRRAEVAAEQLAVAPADLAHGLVLVVVPGALAVRLLGGLGGAALPAVQLRVEDGLLRDTSEMQVRCKRDAGEMLGRCRA